MPDLLVHVLIPWLCLKLVQLRMGKPSDHVIILAMLGAVLPDLCYVNCLALQFGHNISDVVLPFHTPVGACVLAGLISLLFPAPSRVLKWLGFGVLTHFVLDSLLLHAAGGMVLLFPVAWIWGFQAGIMRSTDWPLFLVTIVLSLALVLFSMWKRRDTSSRRTSVSA
jgi:hypothetical protein